MADTHKGMFVSLQELLINLLLDVAAQAHIQQEQVVVAVAALAYK